MDHTFLAWITNCDYGGRNSLALGEMMC